MGGEATCATGASGRSEGDFSRQEIRVAPAKHPVIASQAVGFMVADMLSAVRRVKGSTRWQLKEAATGMESQRFR
jgi:hypothetical protein